MTTPSTSRRPSFPNLAFGMLLVLLGTTFFLHNLGIHFFEELWRFWPVALLILGLGKAFSSRAEERMFGWIVTFIGAVLFARYVVDWPVSMRQFWPGILIIVGSFLMMRAFQGPKPPRDALNTSSTVAERAFVGSVSRRSSSQSFQGGELTAVMGGCELDLREARMAGPEAVIDCFVMWGGIVLQIPPDWAVDSQLSVLAAGFEDKSKPPVQPVGRLVIRGTAMMGGIEIKN